MNIKDLYDMSHETHIDSRDLVARLELLEGEREDHVEEIVECREALAGTEEEDDIVDAREALVAALSALEDWDGDYLEELEALRKVCEEGDSLYADWRHGETLIAEESFVAYAQELAEDIGAIDREASWPLNRIDWESAADDLKMDYSSIEINSYTFWGRI